MAADEAARKKPKRGDPDYLNPTHAVVVALLDRLPEGTYHVFIDNFFSSPNLFRQLRKRGIGATGTCRTNCGLWHQHATDKAADTKGHLSWAWNEVSAVPTTDGLVSDIYALELLADLSLGEPDRVERQCPGSFPKHCVHSLRRRTTRSNTKAADYNTATSTPN